MGTLLGWMVFAEKRLLAIISSACMCTKYNMHQCDKSKRHNDDESFRLGSIFRICNVRCFLFCSLSLYYYFVFLLFVMEHCVLRFKAQIQELRECLPALESDSVRMCNCAMQGNDFRHRTVITAAGATSQINTLDVFPVCRIALELSQHSPAAVSGR